MKISIENFDHAPIAQEAVALIEKHLPNKNWKVTAVGMDFWEFAITVYVASSCSSQPQSWDLRELIKQSEKAVTEIGYRAGESPHMIVVLRTQIKDKARNVHLRIYSNAEDGSTVDLIC